MKLINKDALVAEIEKIRAKWFGVNNDFAHGQKGALTDVLSLINTLEVKEVDDEPECRIFPRPIECYSTCKECPFKAQKGERV